MPHARVDRITFAVYGANEAELIAAARYYITARVVNVEQWTLAIDAEDAAYPRPAADTLRATVVATHRPAPKVST